MCGYQTGDRQSRQRLEKKGAWNAGKEEESGKPPRGLLTVSTLALQASDRARNDVIRARLRTEAKVMIGAVGPGREGTMSEGLLHDPAQRMEPMGWNPCSSQNSHYLSGTCP